MLGAGSRVLVEFYYLPFASCKAFVGSCGRVVVSMLDCCLTMTRSRVQFHTDAEFEKIKLT